jgi:DnaJ-class molecular chaperone
MSIPDYYDILDIPRNASVGEIIDAYRLASYAYSIDSQAAYSMFDDVQIQDIRSDIEEAYKTLIHLEKRKAYDRLLQHHIDADSNLISQSKGNVYYLKQQDDADKTRFTGLQLRDIRKSKCISLQQMSERTGIEERVIQAIEEEDVDYLGNETQLKDKLMLYAAELGMIR